MRFDVTNILNAIMIMSESYIQNIDEITQAERKRLDQVEATINQHEGQWTAEYCEQYRREHGTDRRAMDQKMRRKREAAFPRMMFLLDQLHHWTDTIFGGVPSKEFAQTLTLYRSMGIKMSKHELELFEGRIKNYSERRLFNAFSEECGITPTVKVPNIEDIMKQVDAVESAAKSCLNFYAGTDQQFFDCIDQTGTMTPRNKLTTMTVAKNATDRSKFEDLAARINKAADDRYLSEEEQARVKDVLKQCSDARSEYEMQSIIDNADPDVKMLIGLTDFGDWVKVKA